MDYYLAQQELILLYRKYKFDSLEKYMILIRDERNVEYQKLYLYDYFIMWDFYKMQLSDTDLEKTIAYNIIINDHYQKSIP